MMNKFFWHVKLVAQYYVCQWNEKLVNKLYIVSIIIDIIIYSSYGETSVKVKLQEKALQQA